MYIFGGRRDFLRVDGVCCWICFWVWERTRTGRFLVADTRKGQATTTTEADPCGMTNKKGNNKGDGDDNDNRRSFDYVTRKVLRVSSLRMTLFEGLEKKKQRQRQKQIPFGDDKQKDRQQQRQRHHGNRSG
jgi:hypothetical protein